jgi:hypothetical protein
MKFTSLFNAFLLGLTAVAALPVLCPVCQKDLPVNHIHDATELAKAKAADRAYTETNQPQWERANGQRNTEEGR